MASKAERALEAAKQDKILSGMNDAEKRNYINLKTSKRGSQFSDSEAADLSTQKPKRSAKSNREALYGKDE